MNEKEDNYQQTLDYVFSFVDYSKTRMDNFPPEAFTLDNMRALVTALDNPQDKYPTIHVAGTKGKGSVAAFCSSTLHAAEYTVGLYTSPHLHDFTERIQINGLPISQSDLVSLVDEIKPEIGRISKLTTFEITTGLALLHFARVGVDIAVIEVGLGGRLDATNVITPLVSVITSISLDHTYVLGETLTKIAREKSGIIKPTIPVVVSPQVQEAGIEIQHNAEMKNAPLVQVGVDYSYQSITANHSGQVLKIWKNLDADSAIHGKSDSHDMTISIPLLGDHQMENAVTAYAALQIVDQDGFPVSELAIQRGFSAVNWPARFEILQLKPAVIIDAAHNRDSIKKLVKTISAYFSDSRVVLVFGASEDKDIRGMLSELLPIVTKIYATKSYHPRAMEPEVIVAAVEENNVPVVKFSDVGSATHAAMEKLADEEVLLVTGSVFIAAGGREAWLERKNRNISI